MAYFDTYNKRGCKKTLIGNWQEERALEQRTGNARGVDWASKDESQKVYAREYGRPDREDTRSRTMFFDENECAVPAFSKMRSDFTPAQAQPNHYKGSLLGKDRPREQFIARQVRAICSSNEMAASMVRDDFDPYQTTYQTVHSRPEPAPKAYTTGVDVAKPVTIYSEELSSNPNIYSSNKSASTLGRMADFSCPVYEYTKAPWKET